MKILLFLLLPLSLFAQNSEQYYLKAIAEMERKNYHEANKQIDQAILLDSTNLEYRWTKARVNLKSNSSEENFIIAINNLNYIINKGEKSSKIFNALGIAEKELGYSIKNFRRPKKDNIFKDNNAEEMEQLSIFKESLKHLNLASDYFKQAEILKSGSTNNAVLYLETDIKELQLKIQQYGK